MDCFGPWELEGSSCGVLGNAERNDRRKEYEFVSALGFFFVSLMITSAGATPRHQGGIRADPRVSYLQVVLT
jgi:hypothetical protein